MRVLLVKEWRENRALILGFLVLAPVLSVAMKWLLVTWEKVDPQDSVRFFFPGMLGLFVLAVAADLVSSDAASGRLRFLAALPVRPETLWAGKALFLLGSAALYLAWLILVEVLVLSLAGEYWPHLWGEGTARWWSHLVAVPAVGAATLFFSTLLDRGFAAAFAALVVLGGVFLVLRAARATYDVTELWLPLAVLLLVAFFAGSFAAFTRGRIHLEARLRRVILAGGAFLSLTLPVSVGQVLAIEAWNRIDPADGDFAIDTAVDASPDGEWVFVHASRSDDGPLGARSARALWAVSTSDGTVRDLTGAGSMTDAVRAFEEGPGKVVLRRTQRSQGSLREVPLRIVYDLEEGRVESVRPVEPSVVGPPYFTRKGPLLQSHAGKEVFVQSPSSRPVRVPEHWYPTPVAALWGIRVIGRWHHPGERREGILDLESGEVRRIDWQPLLLPPEEDGAAIGVPDPGDRVLRVPLDGSEPEVLVEGRFRGSVVSPDGRHVVIHCGGALWLGRAKDASVRRIDLDATERWDARWDRAGRTFLIVLPDAVHRASLTADGCRVEATVVAPDDVTRAEFCGDRLISAHGDVLRVIRLDGAVTRLLQRGED